MSVFTSLLNNIFAVERRARTPDSQGGWQISYQSLASITGRLRPASSAEIIQAMQELRSITHVLYTVANVDIERGDQVTLDDLTVKIQARRNPSTSDEHWEFDALEIQREVSEDDGS